MSGSNGVEKLPCDARAGQAMGQHPAESVPIFEDLYFLAALSGFMTLSLAWTFPLWSPAWGAFCPLRELTGIPCPTCFGTRALLAAAHGEVWRALRFNPLVGIAGLGLFVFIPWTAGTAVFNGPRPTLSQPTIRKLAWTGAGLVAANWAYLLVTTLGGR